MNEELISRRSFAQVLTAAAATTLAAQEPGFARNAVIRTVLKDMQPAEVAQGATLFHEHVSFTKEFATRIGNIRYPGIPGSGKGPPIPPANETYFMDDMELMVAELAAAKRDGVACLVDGGHKDMGRDAGRVKALSQRSGLPIVMSAGYYGAPFYTPELTAKSDDQIAQDLIREATETPIGAFGEIGTWDYQMTPEEKKIFRAVGKAHKATNIPVFTHTAFGNGALEQLDVLESVGVKPASIAIGHLGGLLDAKVEVHKAVCKRGAFVGFDRQGGNNDANQVPLVMALVEAGYAGNLLFASDFSGSARLKKNGGPGYAQTVTVFGPKLREAGLKEATLHQILVDNSRRFLAFVPKQKHANI